MKRLLIALTAALAFSAQAQFVSGNILHTRANSTETHDRIWAMGFITGVADAYDEELFCIPTGVNVSQLVDVTKDFIKRNPRERHLPAAMLVMLALVDTFPCKKGGGV